MTAYLCSESMQPKDNRQIIKYLKKHSKFRTLYSAKKIFPKNGGKINLNKQTTKSRKGIHQEQTCTK